MIGRVIAIPRLAQFGLRSIAKLELGHRNRPVLALALGRVGVGEAPPEDIESFPDDRRMLAGQRLPKGCDDGVEPVRRMRDAVDQVTVSTDAPDPWERQAGPRPDGTMHRSPEFIGNTI